MLLEIDFKHVKYEFASSLERMTSPHFSDAEARQRLGESFFQQKNIEDSSMISLREDLILFANEAFPESAVNDPIGDLKIWHLWQTGIRSFPYPGQYLPLEIFSQGTKIRSTSSMGVIGECLSGLFATAGIGPWPIVRVINRWPDFIFHDRKNQRFALLESKAFADIHGATSKFEDRFDKKILEDFLLGALQHLVSDRGVSVWGGFTSIKSVDPFKVQLTFVETSLAQNSLSVSNSTVVDMIAEFVLQVALNRFLPQLVEEGPRVVKKTLMAEEGEISPIVLIAINDAIKQLPRLAVEALSEADNSRIIEEVILGLRKNHKKILKYLSDVGELKQTRSGFSTGGYETIREIGDIKLVARRVTNAEAEKIDKNWQPSWNTVGQPIEVEDDDTEVFRCGGLLIKRQYVNYG